MNRPPWTLVLIAPGQKAFASLLLFRNVYLLAGVGCILLIVLIIQFVSDRTVKRIQPVSEAAESVSRGEYGQPLPENGPRDEIGRLTRDFNRMVQGLRERDVIRNPKAGSGRKPTFRIEIYLKFEACVLGFLSIIFKSEVQSSCFL